MAVSLYLKLWSEIQILPMLPAFVKCLSQTCGAANSLVMDAFRSAFNSEAWNSFCFVLLLHHTLRQREKQAFWFQELLSPLLLTEPSFKSSIGL